ncbi:MAG: DUF4878 domain-containing protein [Chitinophagaceae bacterium]|nr:DUF4878 domain-containing protein [Chitinophagaceae bacterium]
MRFKIILLTALAGCSVGGGYEKAENAQDAGRQFIRASLDGDYQKARFYLLQDTTNLLLIERWQTDYKQLTTAEKKQHRDSNIHPLNIKKVNDSTTTYEYYSSYNPKDTTKFTVVKKNGEWVVDLKSILR